MDPPVVPDGEVALSGNGHRAVSLGDVEKARRASVLAYCARVCDPPRIADAADAAFAGLHEMLESAPSDRVLDLDRALLEATRDAAAARTTVSESTSTGERLLSRKSSRTCELMPTLLAARASGRLVASDRAGVERHLSRCADCRDLARRRDEADRAYVSLLGEQVEAPAPAEPFAPGDPEPDVAVGLSAAAEAFEGAWPEPAAGAELDADEPHGFAEPEAGADLDADEPDGFSEPEAGAELDEADEPHGFAEVEAGAELDDADEPHGFAEAEDFAEPEAEADPEAEDFAEPAAEAEFVAERESEPDDFAEPAAEGEVDPEPERQRHDPFQDTVGYPGPPPPPIDMLPPSLEDGDERQTRRSRARWALIAGLFIAGVAFLGFGLTQLGGDDDASDSQRAAERQSPAPPPAQTPAAAAQPSRAERRTEARLRALGDRELAPGHSGDDVKALQKLLGVSQTGNFAEKTAFAVTQFQEEHDLPATGIADEATKRALAQRARPPRRAPEPPPEELGQPGTQQGTPPAGTAPGQAPNGQAPTGQPPAGQ
jgi:hypothetical protein